jgi:NAD-dependent dihydropyrimidine dehydrogenase PreA subunit
MPPEINKDNCIACGRCVEYCSEDVFYGSVEGEQPVITYPDVCYHCYSCVLECPVENAIWIRVPMTMTIPFKKS